MYDLTKACAIPRAVKDAVAKRDSIAGHPCCIYCGRPAPSEMPIAYSNAHIVKRSQGGLGIETNIVTLCARCHYKFDDSTERPTIMHYIKAYMKKQYGKWNEKDQVYKKEMQK